VQLTINGLFGSDKNPDKTHTLLALRGQAQAHTDSSSS
jgi:hypothetical protein